MKDLAEILKQKPIYLNDWKEDEKIGVIKDFDDIYITKSEYEATEAPYKNVEVWNERKAKLAAKIKEWENINILFASYGCANYEGDAFVLLEKEGKLFEVNAGHCSCYGLEGQFIPEETSLELIKHRVLVGKLGQDDYSGNEFANELRKFLGI